VYPLLVLVMSILYLMPSRTSSFILNLVRIWHGIGLRYLRSSFADSRLGKACSVRKRELKIVFALLAFPTIRRRDHFGLCIAIVPFAAHGIAKPDEIEVG
jgi:hypothetical protein